MKNIRLPCFLFKIYSVKPTKYFFKAFFLTYLVLFGILFYFFPPDNILYAFWIVIGPREIFLDLLLNCLLKSSWFIVAAPGLPDLEKQFEVIQKCYSQFFYSYFCIKIYHDEKTFLHFLALFKVSPRKLLSGVLTATFLCNLCTSTFSFKIVQEENDTHAIVL